MISQCSTVIFVQYRPGPIPIKLTNEYWALNKKISLEIITLFLLFRVLFSINLLENSSIGISINLEHSEESTGNGISTDEEESYCDPPVNDYHTMGSPYLDTQLNRYEHKIFKQWFSTFFLRFRKIKWNTTDLIHRHEIFQNKGGPRYFLF